MKKEKHGEIVVYQAKTGAIELNADINTSTVWATQADIANIFNVQRPAITKHIRNISKDRELNAKSVCSKMEHTAEDGKRDEVQVYNLDIIFASG